MVLDYCDGLLFEVVVVSWGFIDDPFNDVWEIVKSFEEHAHQLATAYSISCFVCQHFEVADILVDAREVECKAVKACLGNFLLCRIGKL